MKRERWTLPAIPKLVTAKQKSFTIRFSTYLTHSMTFTCEAGGYREALRKLYKEWPVGKYGTQIIEGL